MIHPNPYSTNEACDYTTPPGEHCTYPCKRCGAPWYAADSACPTNCADKHPELPKNVSYGDAIPNPPTRNGGYAIEDSLVVPQNIPAGDYVLGYRCVPQDTNPGVRTPRPLL